MLDGELATCHGRLAGLGEGCSNCWRMLDETKVKPMMMGCYPCGLPMSCSHGSQGGIPGKTASVMCKHGQVYTQVDARLAQVQEELHHTQWWTGLMAAAVCVTTLASIVAAVYARITSQKVRLSFIAGNRLEL